ncbi:MAG: class I SAM-dependent methyltransferase [Ramlibacter sp.]|nr:class I SAM-dependent methyltransferase [Ramlibacter sp.]
MFVLRKLAEMLRFLRFGPTRLDALAARLDARQDAADARQDAASVRTDEIMRVLTAAEQRSGELHSYLRGVQAELHAHQAAAGAQAAELYDQAASTARAVRAGAEDARREAEWTRNQVSALGAALDRLQRSAGAPGAAVPAGAAAAQEGFYPTLEHHFRGSAEDLRARLGAYRRWLLDLPPGPVADLGCGRGEWLELLGEWGVTATGVDLNAPNVEGMRARGLDVHHADALEWLQAQPEGSLAAVTSFHVIEHLPFGVLLRLVQEARRVLAPGGRLIMETPNPENVIVATQTFWLDPTHVRPLPPALLEVVVRDAGLELEALLRLNPPAEDGHDIADPTLRALMTQGRDCAVVARKPTAVAA